MADTNLSLKNGGHCQPLLFTHPRDPSIGHFELANLQTIQSLISSSDIDCEFHVQTGVRGLYAQAEWAAAQDSLATLEQTDAALAAHMRLVSDKDELRRLRIPTAVGAIVTDVAARLWPYKFVSHILEGLLTSSNLLGSFNLQTHTPVTSFKPAPAGEQGWEVVTPRGSIIAKKVLLATNAYTSFLLEEYADLIVPARGQMSALLPPPQLRGENRLRTSFGFMGGAQDDYLIQRERRERGGGSEQLLYGGGRSEGPSLYVSNDDTIDPRTAVYLRSALNTLLGAGDTKAPELEATHEWTGIMGFSRDNSPFVGPVPARPGVFVSAGYTGHGMPNAWLCGKAVATMVSKAISGSDQESAVAAAVQDGLPEAYIPSDRRVQRARTAETVERQDRLTGFKAEWAE